MIDATMIEERRKAIQLDIDKLQKTIAEVGEQQKQLQANMFALHGALQQCDQFLGMFSKEEEANE